MVAFTQDRIDIGAIDVSGFPIIKVQIRCLSGNNLIQPLLPSQFLFIEDTTKQSVTISCPDRLRYSTSVAFGIDRSMGSKVETAKTAADSMLKRFRFPTTGNDEVSVWSFASFPNKDLSFNQSTLTISQTIQSITEAQFPFNGTSLFETMYRAIEDVNQFGKNFPKAIIFFTDGVNHTNLYSRTLDDVRIRANTSSIRIYVVGMQAPSNGEADMRQLCNATGGFFVPDYSNQSLDSIYDALTLEPIQNYFCTLSFNSAFCPDGSDRTLLIRYYPSPTDSIATVVHYNSPRIESFLQSLPVWITPDSIQAFTNKKDYSIAFGLSLQSSQQFSVLEFFISHPASVIIDTLLPDGIIKDAIIKIIPTIGGTRINISNVSQTIPSEEIRFGWLKMKSIGINGYRTSIRLTTSIPGCKTSKQITSSVYSTDVSIDTVLGQVNKMVSIPVRVSAIHIQEGFQQLQLHFRFPSISFQIDTTKIFQLNNSLSWSITNRTFQYDAAFTSMIISLEGTPILKDTIIGLLNLAIKQTASMFNEIKIEPQYASTINSFAVPQPLLKVHNGLVVLQDTCRGDLSLIAVPYNQIRQNTPNPFNPQTNISFTIAHDGKVLLTMFDLLSHQRAILFEGMLKEGSHLFQFDANQFSALESGVYVVLLQTSDWMGSIKIILLR